MAQFDGIQGLNMSYTAKSSRHRRAQGFSLIEVLVTVLILGIGLLGIAGLQLRGMQVNHSAYLRSQATFMAYDVLDRMRSNREVALTSNNYRRNFGDKIKSGYKNCANNPCSTQELATYDLNEWITLVKDRLPEGDAEVSFTGTGGDRIYTVNLRWRDTRLTKAEDSSTGQSQEMVQFTYKAQL